MESKQKEVWFWMYCAHCKHELKGFNEEPCNECQGQPYNWDSHKPVNYIWNGKGKEPLYDSTDERIIWHDHGEVVADESISEDSTDDE